MGEAQAETGKQT